MLKSFILVKVKPGTEKNFIKKIFEVPKALEAHSIMGEFDFLVVLGLEETLTPDPWKHFTEIITENLRTIPGIIETQTVIPTASKIKKNKIFELSKLKKDHLFELSKLARGFIYIDTKLGKEASVMYKLFKMDEIREIHLLPGKHDILAVIEVRKSVLPPRYPDLIEKIVIEKISKIADIQNTESIIPDKFNYKR